MTALLGLRNLSKRFGYRTILQELNLDIQAGECVLLLGNNGAGKSTLLRLCATLLKPQQGQILYEGMPIDEDKHRYLRDMGSIAHESRLYGDLSPRENLHFFGVLYELKDLQQRIPQALQDVQLSHAIDLPVKTFSSGMTKRTAIARLLLQQPKLLLLDEPYTGLDQNSVRWFQEYLLDFRNQGGTLLLVTHQLELGLELATRVLLLSHRRIVKDQSSSTINLSECQQWLSQS